MQLGRLSRASAKNTKTVNSLEGFVEEFMEKGISK
jgi:hypothetical protein